MAQWFVMFALCNCLCIVSNTLVYSKQTLIQPRTISYSWGLRCASLHVPTSPTDLHANTTTNVCQVGREQRVGDPSCVAQRGHLTGLGQQRRFRLQRRGCVYMQIVLEIMGGARAMCAVTVLSFEQSWQTHLLCHSALALASLSLRPVTCAMACSAFGHVRLGAEAIPRPHCGAR